MIILGIESSCDETSVALVKNGTDVLKVKTFSQIKTHGIYGGVVPEIASRIHVRVIHHLVKQLFQESEVSPVDIDLISVTRSPGLITSLLVGVSFANAYAFALNKPIVGINHLEAHIYAAFLDNKKEISLPALVLLVSGGHTLLIEMKAIGNYNILGSTLDDAVGEAYDKTAKLLNLPYPGGPEIDRLAAIGDDKAFSFPKALLNDRKTIDFSFSGLKTSVLYKVKGVGNKKGIELNQTNIQNVAASFQKSVVDVLTKKTEQALRKTSAKSLIVGGGVAANQALQSAMRATAEKFKINSFIPPLKYCTDNAAMIAGLAYHKQDQASSSVNKVLANDLFLNETH